MSLYVIKQGWKAERTPQKPQPEKAMKLKNELKNGPLTVRTFWGLGAIKM